MTRTQCFTKAAEILRAAGIDSFRAEAEILSCFCFNIERKDLILAGNKDVSDEDVKRLEIMSNERAGGRPLQYVMGIAPFCGLELFVDERVLIPRFETEELVLRAVELIRSRGYKNMLDICTGSGAIAVAADRMINDSSVEFDIIASDISDDAIAVAMRNAAGRFPVIKSDLFSAFSCLNSDSVSSDTDTPSFSCRKFDLITANPPYIPTKTVDGLDSLVKDHEPHLALDGGADGLDLVRRIINALPDMLNPGGTLLMEIGDDQGDAVKSICPAAVIHKDINGQDRIVEICLS